MIRGIRTAVAALLLAAATGCAADPAGGDDGAGGEGGTQVSSPLAGCAELTSPPPEVATPGPDQTEPAATGPAATGPPLPELTLPCFTGGEPFPLADLAGPAVVNLWASWCAPCREELPALQRFADRAAGQVHVVGVVTQDRPAAAAALAEDLGITFPALDDRDQQLLDQLDTVALPATLFVDGTGRIAYLHRSGAIDDAGLARHAAEQLGVVVA